MSNTLIRRIAPLAGLGAMAATLGDLVHVHTQTLAYPHPFVLGQAWWVFPVFLVAFMLMGASYRFLAMYAPSVGVISVRSRLAGSVSAFVEALLAFMFIYFLSGFGNQEPVLMSWIFYGTFVLRCACTYERAGLLLLALLMAIGGMLAEGCMGAGGLVAYRHSDVFHVPLWLGGLYMHGAFALRAGMRLFAPEPG